LERAAIQRGIRQRCRRFDAVLCIPPGLYQDEVDQRYTNGEIGRKEAILGNLGLRPKDNQLRRSPRCIPRFRCLLCLHDDIPGDILRPQRLPQAHPTPINHPQPLPQLSRQLRHHSDLRLRSIPAGYSQKKDDDVIGRGAQIRELDLVHQIFEQGAWSQSVLWRSWREYTERDHRGGSADDLRSSAIGPLRQKIFLGRGLNDLVL